MKKNYLKFAVIFALLNIIPNIMIGSTEEYRIRQVDDPLILSHRFVQIEAETSFNNAWIPLRPVSPDSVGLCAIAQNWYRPDTLTAFIFYRDIFRRQTIAQFNLNALNISSHIARDFDNDGLDEIAAAHYLRDTVWVEIIDPQDGFIYTRRLASGQDLNGNGYWDGNGSIAEKYDVNGDGIPEILGGIDTGYDLYPRKVFCLDWKNDRILWEYEIAGVLNGPSLNVAKNAEGEIRFVFTVGSKGNMAVTEDMDDLHSYLIVLDKDGNELWKRTMTGVFGSSHARIIDFDNDGIDDICATASYDEPDTTEGGNFDDRAGGLIRIYDLDGKLKKSYDLGIGGQIHWLDQFDLVGGVEDEIIANTEDNRILVYDQHLNILFNCYSYSDTKIIDARDYVGNGKRQFLLLIGGDKLRLTDRHFNPLAQFISPLKMHHGYYYDSREDQQSDAIVLNASGGKENYTFGIVKAPWYTIFSRQPILAFLAAFIPLSLIIGIIWYVLFKFRQKNLTISRQRDKLNETLIELRDTQQKLIEAEKFKLAKDIAGGVAHEIHNALMPALGSIHKLRQICTISNEQAPDKERIGRLLNLVDKAVDRANNMTRLVNEYSRLDREKKREEISVAEVIRDIISDNKIRIDEMGAKVSVDIKDSPKIKCLRQHCYSMINNLFINALDALEESRERNINISVVKENSYIKIAIEDSGPGISNDNYNRIFDAFFSTKPNRGTGLGLAVVKKVVDLYEGKIEVKSGLDKGVKFVIFFNGVN